MKQLLIIPIKAYQWITGGLKKSGWIKDTCVFYPTCSAYAIDAINKYGIIAGARKSIMRICRCHPWQKEHFDPA